MAKAGARVHIYGDWDGTGVKKAKQDLSGFQKQAQGFTGAIGKSFLGMGAAIGGALALGNLASFAKDFSVQAIQMAQESQKTTDRIEAIAKSMGVFDTVLGSTTKRLTDYAQELQDATGISDETTKSGQAILLTFAELAKTAGDAGGMFDRATAALLDLSAAGFGDATQNAKSLGKALNDPIKGLTALGRQGITFTEQEKEKVKALVDTNQTLAAQELIMAAVEKQVGGTAAAMANDFDKIKAAADDAQEIIGFALVDAVENLSDAMGGSAGLSDVVRGLGEGIADFVAGLGLATIEIVNFLNAAAGVEASNKDANQSFIDFGTKMLDVVFHTNLAMGALWDWTEAGAAYRDEQAAIDATNLLATQRYTQMAVALGVVEVSTEAMAAEAEAAKEALNDLKDAAKSLRDTISDSQSLDDYRRKLMDLSETLKGNARNFSNASEAGRENRDTLRELFSDAAGQAERWAERTGASVDEFEAKFDGKAVKIIDAFVAQGFDRADVEDFLNKQGIWTSELRRLQATVTDESEKLGYQIPRGISVGVKRGEDALRSTVSGTVLSAIQAGKDAAKIKSPSQVTRDQIGLPLAQGIVEGIKAGGDGVRQAMQENFLSWFKDTKESLKSELDDAKRMFEDYRSSVSQSIMGGIDFGSIAPEFDESGQRVGMTFIEALNAQAAQAQAFAVKVKELVALGLSEAALTQVLQAGVSAGTNIANELITGGATTIAETNELVATTQAAADEVGLLAANSFYATGVKNAQDTYNGFKANFGQGGPARAAIMKVMDNLANSMNRTATITVTTVNRTVNEVIGRYGGERAMGGPVAASTAYLVGERGPELFIPNSAGQIIPNGDLPTASGTFTRGGDGASMGGTSYTINVQAGVGDPRQIGQQVVEYIKRFESANGRVFAAA